HGLISGPAARKGRAARSGRAARGPLAIRPGRPSHATGPRHHRLDAAPPRALPRLAGRARHAVPGRQHRRRGIVPGLTARTPGEILALWFGPGPFRDRVANWPDVARATLAALRREALVTGNDDITALLHRAERLSRELPLRRAERLRHAGRLPG